MDNGQFFFCFLFIIQKKSCIFAEKINNCNNKRVMCTVLVTYDQKNKVAKSLMYALSQTKGVEIDEDAILTADEVRRIEKARKSGIRTDIENLQAYLKSQYES